MDRPRVISNEVETFVSSGRLSGSVSLPLQRSANLRPSSAPSHWRLSLKWRTNHDSVLNLSLQYGVAKQAWLAVSEVQHAQGTHCTTRNRRRDSVLRLP